ncbi:MAG: B12-binding domain-containing radical SAM protein [Nanoarchaeota archaeon]|nr:B12-binding domain-containing radical SAM protein [Nanoarchaeota archaeon]
MKKKIILSYPEKRVREKVSSIAYGIMPIARALLKAGFEVQILDTRVQDYHNVDLKGVLLFGISTMTGPQIKHGIELAQWVRKTNKDIPIVWGGIHPTLLPEETAKNKFVDIVVRGEGEETIVELAKRLQEGKGYDDLPGLTFRNGKNIVSTQNSHHVDLNTPGLPPYHLLDKSKYDFKDFTSYCSSRGCPHRCNFCFNQEFYKGKWHSRNIDHVITDIKWMKKNLKCKRIGLIDDNFFVNKKRVEDICNLLIKEKVNVKWSAMCRYNYFDNYNLAFLRLIKKAGCYELGLGAESGSPRILKLVKKDITVKQILEGTKKCVQAGIHPVVSFMCGFPEETKEDVLQTLDVIDKLRKIDPDVEINGLFIYTPYPGGELFEILRDKYKVKFPRSLEAWSKWDFSSREILTWYPKDYLRFISTVSTIVRYQFLLPNLKKYAKKYPFKPTSLMFFASNWFFELSSKIRWKMRWFGMPFEWDAWDYVNRKVRGEH